MNSCELHFFDTKESAINFTDDRKYWEILWSINEKRWLAIKINENDDIKNHFRKMFKKENEK
jgi:hypothetical protein|tara:strand:+ start:1572 stop:1757 length:186 start_codon:yes stop_codon:yes gene_type:complete